MGGKECRVALIFKAIHFRAAYYTLHGNYMMYIHGLLSILHASHLMFDFMRNGDRFDLVWWETLVLVSSLSWLHLDNTHHVRLR